MKLFNVAPTGKRKTVAFVDWTCESCKGEGCLDCGFNGMQGELREIEVSVYPPSPLGETFRSARVLANASLSETAERLGIKPSELSALERGRVVPESWPELFAALGFEMPAELQGLDCGPRRHRENR